MIRLARKSSENNFFRLLYIAKILEVKKKIQDLRQIHYFIRQAFGGYVHSMVTLSKIYAKEYHLNVKKNYIIILHIYNFIKYIKNENFRRKVSEEKLCGKTFRQIFKFRQKNFFKRKNFRTGVFNNILPNFSSRLRLKGNDLEGCRKMFFYSRYLFFKQKTVSKQKKYVNAQNVLI